MQYVFMTLFASAMWGSWMQSTKHLEDFPVEGFILILYTSSLLLVWGALFAFKTTMLPDGIINSIQGKETLALTVMVCGGIMSLGLLINITTMKDVGMILVTSVSSVVSTILGLLISVFIGGLPSSISVVTIVLALVITLGASFTCQYAGIRRDLDNGKEIKNVMADRKYIIFVILANICISFYVVGYSLGTATEMNPNGFAPILCVALLALGSFISVLVATIYLLIKKKQMSKVFSLEYKKQKFLAVISGFCHYGGNILNIVATPALSAPISFLLGKTADFWTYTWGLVYGEFSGSKPKTKIILYSGFGLYIIGIFVLVSGLYS